MTQIEVTRHSFGDASPAWDTLTCGDVELILDDEGGGSLGLRSGEWISWSPERPGHTQTLLHLATLLADPAVMDALAAAVRRLDAVRKAGRP